MTEIEQTLAAMRARIDDLEQKYLDAAADGADPKLLGRVLGHLDIAGQAYRALLRAQHLNEPMPEIEWVDLDAPPELEPEPEPPTRRKMRSKPRLVEAKPKKGKPRYIEPVPKKEKPKKIGMTGYGAILAPCDPGPDLDYLFGSQVTQIDRSNGLPEPFMAMGGESTDGMLYALIRNEIGEIEPAVFTWPVPYRVFTPLPPENRKWRGYNPQDDI